MSHTAKLVEARDRIKALAGKKHDEADRNFARPGFDSLSACVAVAKIAATAAGLDIAVRVIEDLLQD